MRRFALGLLLVACNRVAGIPLDTSLPDGPEPEVLTPTEALQASARARDPVQRGAALAALLRTDPPEAVAERFQQAAWDPNPWVVTEAIEVLSRRSDVPEAQALLIELALREAADPVVRARLALSLHAEGVVAPLAPLAEAWRAADPDERGPLLLVAATLGSAEATAALLEALASGPAIDDPVLAVQLGLRHLPGTREALARAASAAEEGSALPVAAARALLGDPAGAADWRSALAGREPDAAREALDLLMALPPTERPTWLQLGKGARDPAVRAALALLSAPERAVARAAGAPSPFVREVAARRAGELGPEVAAEVAVRLVADEEPDLRVAGALLAARHRVRLPEALLRTLLVDDRPAVRVAGYAAAMSALP